MKAIRSLLVILLVVSLPVATFAQDKNKKDDVEAIGDRDVDGNLNFYSIDKEIALGKQLAAEVERTAKVVDDPLVAEYINRVGQNLARNSDGKVPFEFKILESPQINAFALPGGFLFVHTGLILQAETEGELAGVLAHEIAHVAARHATRQATRGQLFNLASIPLIFVGGGLGYAVRSAAGLALPLTFLTFSRGFEREADCLGVQYLYSTGYDPQAFVQFFEKLQAKEKKKPGTLAKAFSSHPQTPDRIEATQKEIESVLPDREQYVVTTSEFDDVKARLAVLQNRRKVEDDKDGKKPSLRRTSTGDGKDGEGKTTEEEEPPVLKRRD